MGRDLDGMGKSIFAPKKTAQTANAGAANANVAIAPKSPAVVAEKPHDHGHAPVPLSKLQPKLAKSAVTKPEPPKPQPFEAQAEEGEEILLEDIVAQGELQEVPAQPESMEGATAVDWDGDGRPDARYKQRTP